MPDGKYFMKLGALGDSDHYVSELQSCYQDTRYNGTCGNYCAPRRSATYAKLGHPLETGQSA